MEPFVKFTGASGLMEQPDNVVIRKMSDMAAAYADSQKAREWIENGDPVVYEMLEALVPQAAGELMFCTTRINPGTVGREYFMTKGHYHEDPTTAEIYYTVSGRGILLAETKDRRHVALEMRKGSIIHVEPGWAHRTYNTGEEPLVFLAVYPANAGHDYRTIEQEGFAHTVVKGDNGPVVVKTSTLR